jgi:hypothetical protein
VKKSEMKIKCKQCNKEIFKFPNLNYNEPRKFCSHKCFSDYYKENYPQGEKHHLWKGNKASYITQHQWIARNYGKASKCVECGTKKSKRYHWANISGNYQRDVKDYKQLCVSCHIKFNHINKYGDKCRRGHIRISKEGLRYKNGKWKECPECRRENYKSRKEIK